MSSALTAKTPAGMVVIAPEVYRNLQQYRQTGRKHETGGALAGYKADDNTWIICSLMHPSLANKSGRTWLERDLSAAQEFATRVNRQSEGQLTYIGEWHTHPDKFPTPSGADIGMLSDILAGSRPLPEFIFGLILGIGGAICLWYQDQSGRTEIYRLPRESAGKKAGRWLRRLVGRK
jgi:integrative and conjugative element protein (TIGR02256 family)